MVSDIARPVPPPPPVMVYVAGDVYPLPEVVRLKPVITWVVVLRVKVP
jgi:hypothetical protein